MDWKTEAGSVKVGGGKNCTLFFELLRIKDVIFHSLPISWGRTQYARKTWLGSKRASCTIML